MVVKVKAQPYYSGHSLGTKLTHFLKFLLKNLTDDEPYIEKEDFNEWPPFRKVGLYDPYSGCDKIWLYFQNMAGPKNSQ